MANEGRTLWKRWTALRQNRVAGLEEPAPPTPSRRRRPFTLAELRVSERQADILMRAASHHHARIEALAKTEWTVSLAFWTGLLVTGAALIHAAGGDKKDIAYLIYQWNFTILAGLLVSVYLFIFGFSSNQSQSITTERNRFLLYQSAALKAVGVLNRGANDALHVGPKLATPLSSPAATCKLPAVHRSTVWSGKLLSSTAFVLSIWITGVAVAGVRSTRSLSWTVTDLDWLATLDLPATVNFAGSALLIGTWCYVATLIHRRALAAER